MMKLAHIANLSRNAGILNRVITPEILDLGLFIDRMRA